LSIKPPISPEIIDISGYEVRFLYVGIIRFTYPGFGATLLLRPACKGTSEFRSISPVFFCRLHIYISNPAKPNTARHPIAIPIIPPVDRSFFEDELAVGEVDTVDVEEDVAPMAVVPRVGFKVSLGKYSSGLNSSVAFCE
jgi:hypothetical protein